MTRTTKHALINFCYGALAWVAVGFLVLVCCGVIGGCGKNQRAIRGGTVSQLDGVTIDAKDAEARLRAAANQIQESTAEISAAVPEVKKQTDELAHALAEIRAADEVLLGLIGKLEKAEKEQASMAKDLTAAHREIERLEDKANGTLNTILIGVSIAGLGLAVVSGVWLRSWQGVLTGLSIFAACTGGMWLIKYRGWIAVGGLVIAAGYAVWCIIANRKIATDVVRTVEVIKPFVEDFKTKANQVQTSEWTRKQVDKIKSTFRKPKA